MKLAILSVAQIVSMTVGSLFGQLTNADTIPYSVFVNNQAALLVFGEFSTSNNPKSVVLDHVEYDFNSPSQWNVVNYFMGTHYRYYQNFNVDSYPQRNRHSASSVCLGTGQSPNEANAVGARSVGSESESAVEMMPEYIPSSVDTDDNTRSIIGSDDRNVVANPRLWPYFGTGRIVATFNVKSQIDGHSYERSYVGTGFMENKHFFATAAHVVFADHSVSDYDQNGNLISDEFDDHVVNPVFADRIVFYPGRNGTLLDDDISTEGVVISIKKAYRDSQTTDEDWAIVEVADDIGYQTGWYGTVSNWYESNHSLTIYSYPGDMGNLMTDSPGNLLGETTRKYRYDNDTTGGSSGAGILTTIESGTYMCGIHTGGSNTYNSGTKIDTFIFRFINSFIASRNWPSC